MQNNFYKLLWSTNKIIIDKVSHLTIDQRNEWKFQLAKDVANLYYDKTEWYDQNEVGNKYKQVMLIMMLLDSHFDDITEQFRIHGELLDDKYI